MAESNIKTLYKYLGEEVIETKFAKNLINEGSVFFRQTKYSDKNKKNKKNLLLISKNSIEFCIFDELERIVYYKNYNIKKDKDVVKQFLYDGTAVNEYEANNIMLRLTNASSSSVFEVEDKNKICCKINDQKLKLWKTLMEKSLSN